MTAFDALFAPDDLRAAVSARAWLEGMLSFESALAGAGRELGLVPADAADAIARACEVADFDVEAVWTDGRRVGNPAEALVRAIRAQVGDAERYVHLGATSQDAIDTAAMLVTGRAFGLIEAALGDVATSCATLAEKHRDTPMAGRTLLQQAVPITFGLKAAGWLDRVLDARASLWIADAGRAVQLGGAAGTLSGYGTEGRRVVELVGQRLGLGVPTLPWHASRGRIVAIGSALAEAAAAAAGIALDVVLLAQTEVAEVSESTGGGSSAMPHKRNPTHSVLARAAARVAIANSTVLVAPTEHEHERAAGAWHAEWEGLTNALLFTGAAVVEVAHALDGLEVDVERMRANLDLTGGLVFSEQVASALAEPLGRQAAHALVAEAAGSAGGSSFRERLLVLAGDHLDESRVDALLDPASVVDSSGAFVDDVLTRYREQP